MAGGYVVADGGEYGKLVRLISDIQTQIRELGRPTGGQFAEQLTTLRNLVDGLIAQVNGNFSGYLTVAGQATVNGPIFSPHALANPVVTGYFALYVNSDARIGRTVSARRYKQDIAAWTPDVQGIFALQLVTYRLKSEVALKGDDASLEWGLVAEELIELGLDWLVLRIDGKVEGIAYERLALALLPAIQDQERRLLALEEQVVQLVADWHSTNG